MNWMSLVILVAALATYGSFVWAVKHFFKIPSTGMPSRMKAIAFPGSVTMLVSLVCLGWPGNAEGDRALIGLGVFILSLTLFWWAIRTNQRKPLNIAFTEAQPSHLVQEGPYRFVRHPFYTSYIIAWVAGPIASAQYWLLVPAAFFTYFYYRAATLEESLFADSSHSESYLAYRKRTGMFFPRFFHS